MFETLWPPPTLYNNNWLLNEVIVFIFDRRNQNVRDIISCLNLGHKCFDQFDINNQFHHLFFLGDLNYRLENIEPTVSLNTT